MWWYCGYRAVPGVGARELSDRFLRQHDAGTNRPECVRGWFSFGSGTAGYVMIETDTVRELTAVLAPYSGLVEWTVEPVSEVLYPMYLEEAHQRRHAQAVRAGRA